MRVPSGRILEKSIPPGVRRISVGLQEGQTGLQKEGTGKVTVRGSKDEAFQEIETALLQRVQYPQPQLPVFPEKSQPTVKSGRGDAKTFADLWNRQHVPEVYEKHTQDKEQAVGFIGDDGVGKNGMGTAAGALHTVNGDYSFGGFSADKVNDVSVIGREGSTVTGAPAHRAGFFLRP